VLGGGTTFVQYRATLAPRFWLWTKRRQNRIFQQQTIPDILKQVLSGLDVRFDLTGSYSARDYCVQYRESDFAFASRLMEDEGIGYYFEHAKDRHTLVVTDTKTTFAPLPEQSQLTYQHLETRSPGHCRVRAWEKVQDIVPSQYQLEDHCFELQDHHLKAATTLTGSVAVGTVSHDLVVGPAHELTLADYPGEYAQRFDGITSDGQPQPEALTEIFADGERTVRIRMEQEAALSLKVHGTGDYSHLAPGYTFTLEKHFNGDGDYLLTNVEHRADIRSSYLTGDDPAEPYENRFTAMPVGLHYRPSRVTPRPKIEGTQSATVVGPAGQTVFCDKYGRIKVQFRWDGRSGKDEKSSCWLRVSQPWAGEGFGSFHLPRVGQEVVVGFEEGDPDRPIVLGSVYNSTNMPPYSLPENASSTGILTRTLNDNAKTGSELRFEESAVGEQAVHLHAANDLFASAENNRIETVGNQHQLNVGNGMYVCIGGGSKSGGAAPTLTSKDKKYLDKAHHSGKGGGADDQKEIFGLEFDIAEDWKLNCDSMRTFNIGNSFTMTLGATESFYMGNYTRFAYATFLSFNVGVFNASITIGLVNVRMNVGACRVQYNAGALLNLAKTRSDNVSGAYAVTVGGVYATTVTGAMNVTVGSYSLISEGNVLLTLGTVCSIELSPAMMLLNFASSRIEVTAAGIVLSAGPAKLAITPQGITKDGAQIATL
jgi:type VI secretion system secreted protein VgrG